MDDQIDRAWFPETVVSGGVEGVELVALQVARAHSIRTGGFCLRGAPSASYDLVDHWSISRHRVVAQNMRVSHATIVCLMGDTHPRWGWWDLGDLRRFARALGQPCAVVDLHGNSEQNADLFQRWLEDLTLLSGQSIVNLHITGPDERECRGASKATQAFLERCWIEVNHGDGATEDGTVDDTGGSVAVGREEGPERDQERPSQDEGECVAGL